MNISIIIIIVLMPIVRKANTHTYTHTRGHLVEVMQENIEQQK